jgi:DNA-binding transcriptional LysR family regulator
MSLQSRVDRINHGHWAISRGLGSPSSEPICSTSVKRFTLAKKIARYSGATVSRVDVLAASSVAFEPYLLDEARQILAQVERTKANVRNRARGETGHIRVGFAGATYFQPRVPGLVQAYRRRYPSVVLSPVQGNTPGLVDAVQNGSVDVAFVRAPPVEGHQEITVHFLVEETTRIVLPSNHPQARKRFASLATFAQETIILPPRVHAPGLYDSVIASCQGAGFSPILKHEDPVMGITSITYLVAAGFGISIVPRSFEHIRTEGIVYIPIKGEAPRAAIGLAVRKDNHSALIRNFVALARPRARAPD